MASCISVPTVLSLLFLRSCQPSSKPSASVSVFWQDKMMILSWKSKISKCYCTAAYSSSLCCCCRRTCYFILRFWPSTESWYIYGRGKFRRWDRIPVCHFQCSFLFLILSVHRLLLVVPSNDHARYFACFCITSGTYTTLGLIIAWCQCTNSVRTA